jgi:hypothetical protein
MVTPKRNISPKQNSPKGHDEINIFSAKILTKFCRNDMESDLFRRNFAKTAGGNEAKPLNQMQYLVMVNCSR